MNMEREKYNSANKILKKIEELDKQVRYLKLYDHCGLVLYPASEIDEPKEERFGVYLDKKSLENVVQNKKQEIKELEKEFESL